MKILLISVNRETEPFTAAPLGLALVASALRRAGHDIFALDLLFSDDPKSELKDAIRTFSPSLVGVSIRNVESSNRFLLPDYKEVIGLIKCETVAPVLIGGPGYSIMPKAVLEYLGADFGIAGEGELAAALFAGAVEGTASFTSVPGLCWHDGGSYIQNPKSPISLKGLGLPAWDLFPAGKYDLLGIQSKRGCSFSCVYCTYPGLEGREMHLRPPEEVVFEMEGAIDGGLRTPFYFVDNIFNNPPGHAEAICDEIINRKIAVSFGCLASPVGLDVRLLEKMKRAGCESVEIGADSLCDRMLLKLGKKFNKVEALKAIGAARQAGLMGLVFLLLGGPDEDEDSLKETFDALEDVQPDKVFAVGGVRIYPGTPLARLAVGDGLISAGDPLLLPKFYVSDKLGERLYEMSEEFFKTHPGWVYFPAKGGGEKAFPEESHLEHGGNVFSPTWDDFALEVFEKILSEVPALIRPMARKAVRKKVQSAAKSGRVTGLDVKDAFLSETPRPFQGSMRESLKRLGLLDG